MEYTFVCISYTLNIFGAHMNSQWLDYLMREILVLLVSTNNFLFTRKKPSPFFPQLELYFYCHKSSKNCISIMSIEFTVKRCANYLCCGAFQFYSINPYTQCICEYILGYIYAYMHTYIRTCIYIYIYIYIYIVSLALQRNISRSLLSSKLFHNSCKISNNQLGICL